LETGAVHHVGLAVSKLNETASFFIDCLGWDLVREVPDYPAKFVSNGSSFFTLWQTDEEVNSFNRRSNVGLHHIAIRVPKENDLVPLFEKVCGFPGVAIDFAPELLKGGPAKHFMVFEPSGLRMEFIWAP